MKIIYRIYEIVTKEIMVEGNYVSDYQSFSDYCGILVCIDNTEYSSMEEALNVLSLANVSDFPGLSKNDFSKVDITILPIITKK